MEDSRTRSVVANAWLVMASLSLASVTGVAFADVAEVARPAQAPLAAPGSLYSRLGGTSKVHAFVAETIDTVARDPRMNQSFDKVDLKRVKDLLTEQICSLTGGGCTYTGDSMKDVHAGHHISNAEFFQLVEVLRDAMRREGVGLRERNELLAILAPMKRDVVEK